MYARIRKNEQANYFQQLTRTVGKVKIQKSKKINYLDYKPKDKSSELDYTGILYERICFDFLKLNRINSGEIYIEFIQNKSAKLRLLGF